MQGLMGYFVIVYLVFAAITDCLIVRAVRHAPTDIELWGEETE